MAECLHAQIESHAVVLAYKCCAAIVMSPTITCAGAPELPLIAVTLRAPGTQCAYDLE
jgi:hypothetical protein